MTFIIGKVCPGIKNRTGALISAGVSLLFGALLITSAILSMLFTYRESLDKEDRRTEAAKEMLQCYYGAGFALWAVWVMFTCVLIFGIMVENKRALGYWLIYTLIIPVYFLGGLLFLSIADLIRGWEIQYIVMQVVCILCMIWAGLAVWVYFGEIKQRDKNPELRENEILFAQPFGGVMPPAGSYNPGYGAPSGGSMSSIPRSQKSRHTYAPTETGESVRGPSLPRQSRLDQFRAQHVEKSPIKSERSRSHSGEREGGTTYYRYQYTADEKYKESLRGSQGSLGGRQQPPPQSHDPPQYQQAQYQPARFQRPQPAPQPSAYAQYGSQGSLGGRQPYQPQHNGSQGNLGGRRPYQPQYHGSQGSLGRQAYQPQMRIQDNQESKDSEV